LPNISITHDLEYLAVFSLVLILPKILMRFKIPSGITAILIGISIAALDPSLKSDQLFRFLSQIGITSLFLFAGLEVEWDELKSDRVYLGKFLTKSLIILFLIAYGISNYFTLPFQESFIYALGIFTPSAGFILNSLHSFEITKDQEHWIKSKAISKELIAIILMFFALQGEDPKKLIISMAFFLALFIILPIVFKLFFKFVSPYAPNSEVPFLIALSLISGVLSKEMGAYYLVGAFVVGIIGGSFKKEIFKEGEENMLHSLSSFFKTFLPFYFFYAGMKIHFSEITSDSVMIGFLLLVIFVPLRLAVIGTSMKFFMSEIRKNPYNISLSLMPTLIFGLVIAGILKERGIMPNNLIYALLIYTLLNSIIPSIILTAKSLKK
jgi:Kef-type K+ transport system membrane component KefB